MKKIILALVLGGMVFSAAYAAAATLGLTTDDLGAGDEVVVSCDDAVNANYTTVLNTIVPPDGPRYDLDDVVLVGLLAACNNHYYKISVLGAGGTLLAEQGNGTSEVVTGAPANFVVDFDAEFDVKAEDIVHIAVVITGPAD